MEFIILSLAYNKYGHSHIYSAVGDLLNLRLGSYGTATERVDIVFYLPGGPPAGAYSLGAEVEKHQACLDQGPKVTFRRALKKFDLKVLSRLFTADDEDRLTRSAHKINTAAGEVASALAMIRKRVKPADDFAVDRFLADVNEALACAYDSLEEWDAISQQAKEKRLAIRASKDPWELLEIDWRKFHPQAKQILDSPFFWEEANDCSPHGNDTGADLLAAFRKWNKKHQIASPIDFLDRLMASWEIEPINWSLADEVSVQQLESEHPIGLAVSNQAAIALAFGVLKVRGTCPPDVAEMALAALTRTEFMGKGRLDDPAKAMWDAAIMQMRGKLESLTDPPQ